MVVCGGPRRLRGGDGLTDARDRPQGAARREECRETGLALSQPKNFRSPGDSLVITAESLVVTSDLLGLPTQSEGAKLRERAQVEDQTQIVNYDALGRKEGSTWQCVTRADVHRDFDVYSEKIGCV